MGRPTHYARVVVSEGEARAQTIAEARMAKAYHFANLEFLSRLRAEHERAGRRVA